MRQKGFKKYVAETFQFEVEKEKIIHLNLCKEKLNRKQRKLLDKKCMFNRYPDWKAYIVGKYEGYSKECLLEFERMLNLLLQDSKQDDSYNQCIWAAYISTILSVGLSETVSTIEVSGVMLMVGAMLIPFFVGIMIGKISDSYGSEKGTTLFLEDVKSIIHELSESK